MTIVMLHNDYFEIITEKYNKLKFSCIMYKDFDYLLFENHNENPTDFVKMLSSFLLIGENGKYDDSREKTRLLYLSIDELELFSGKFIEHHRFLVGKKDSYTKGVENRVDAINYIEEKFKNIEWPTNNIEKLFFSWKIFYKSQFEKKVKETEEYLQIEARRFEVLKKYTNIMREINWVPIFCLYDNQIKQIIDEYEKQNNIDKFEYELLEAVENYFNDEYIEEIRKKWNEIGFLINRLKILNDVIDAHIGKKYTLTIPVLLIQIEGILRDYNENKLGIKVRPYIDDVLRKKYKGLGLKIFEMDNEIKKYLKEVIYKNTINDNSEKGINRNNILHGIDNSYNERKKSIQLILILDYIVRRCVRMKNL